MVMISKYPRIMKRAGRTGSFSIGLKTYLHFNTVLIMLFAVAALAPATTFL
jgi:hypothetical protein